MEQLQIPLTNVCNLNCISCIYKTESDNFERFNITLNEFRNIVEQLPKNTILDLTPVVGEIFANPYVWEILDYLETARNIKYYQIVTNLTLCNDINRLINYSKLKSITVSIYGDDVLSFKKYTNTNAFDDFSENLRELVVSDIAIKGKVDVILYFRSIYYDKYKWPHVNILVELGYATIDESTVDNNFDWSDRLKNTNIVLAPQVKQHGVCRYALEQNCIWPNGNVSMCGISCNDESMMPVGNIFTDTLETIKCNCKKLFPGKLCKKCREYELK
jgi:MoaA/NifB/PqqE/SkfB family radical SAM enzyme